MSCQIQGCAQPIALIKTWVKSPAALRYGGAALAGLLLSASFPRLSLAAGAWIAPGWILFCALGTRGGQAFRIGFVGGLVHFLSSLYWLLNMPFTWHGAPLAPALGWISLSAYCALYPAAWVWLCWKFFPGAATMAGWLRWQGRSATIYWPLVGFLSAGWLRRQGWCLAAGAIWTALEYMRGTFLSGFPWNFVAASQYRISPLIQIASITGIHGVTFLVVWTSVALGCVALAMTRRPAMAGLIAESGLPLLAVAVAVTFGVERIRSAPPPARKLKVAMVQPGIPQTEDLG